MVRLRLGSPADLQGRCDPYISWRLQRAEAYRSVKDGSAREGERTTQSPAMTVRNLQYVLANVFFILGGWCLVSPSSVLALGVIGWRKAEAA